MAEIPRNSYLNFADLFEFSGEIFFDTPDFPELLPRDDDRFILIDQKYFGRLDRLASDFYGNSELWWIIALANNIDLVPTGVQLGVRLRVPSKASVKAYMAQGKKK